MAKTELTSREDNIATLTVELTADEVQKQYKRLYQQLAKEVKIPGFRKGKVPPNVLRRQLGAENVDEYAAEQLKEYAVNAALSDQELVPRGTPRWHSDPDPQDNTALAYEFSMPVLPDVTLPDYAAFELTIPDVSITAEMKDNFRERLAERYTQYEDKAGTAREGDAVSVSISSSFAESGEPAPFAVDKMMYVIGREGNLPGWDEHFTGAEPGKAVEFNYSMPDDFADQRIQGKELAIKADVLGVSTVNRPEVNLEFIKEHFGMETEEQFDEYLETSLKHERDMQAQQLKQEMAMEKLIDELEAEISEDMVTEEIDGLVKENDHQLHHYESSLEEYLKQKDQSLEEYRASLREPAIKKIKHYLAVREIAEKQNTTARNEDYQRYAMLLIQREGIPPEKVQELFRNKEFFNEATYQIIKERVHAHVASSASFKTSGSDEDAGGGDAEPQEAENEKKAGEE